MSATIGRPRNPNPKRLQPQRCADCREDMPKGENRIRCKFCKTMLCIACTKKHKRTSCDVTGAPV